MDFADSKESAQPIKKTGWAVSYLLQNQLCLAAFSDTGDDLLSLRNALEGIDLSATLERQAGVQYKAACLQHLCALQIHSLNMWPDYIAVALVRCYNNAECHIVGRLAKVIS